MSTSESSCSKCGEWPRGGSRSEPRRERLVGEIRALAQSRSVPPRRRGRSRRPGIGAVSWYRWRSIFAELLEADRPLHLAGPPFQSAPGLLVRAKGQSFAYHLGDTFPFSRGSVEHVRWNLDGDFLGFYLASHAGRVDQQPQPAEQEGENARPWAQVDSSTLATTPRAARTL